MDYATECSACDDEWGVETEAALEIVLEDRNCSRERH